MKLDLYLTVHMIEMFKPRLGRLFSAADIIVTENVEGLLSIF
jgi:hypothetical protein